MLWWEMESWPTKMWGIGEKRLRTPVIEIVKIVWIFSHWSAVPRVTHRRLKVF